MRRDHGQNEAPRRTTLLPPPPTNPDVLRACFEPEEAWDIDASDLEPAHASSVPTHWQAGPPTLWDTAAADDIHYRTIASALKI